jgi:hypothetical protein
MTEEKALTTTAPAAIAIAKPASKFSLDGFPEDKYNRLVPTQTIMTTDLLVPVVQVVTLDFEDDTYKSHDVPDGHRAPGARALNKFASAAALSFFDERRVDDGTNPELIRVTVSVAMILPTGQRITATGTKEVDLNRRPWASDKERAKFRSFLYEHVATRARSRAIRAILSLKASYTLEEIRKPFAVVTFVPNTAHPDVRQAMLQAMAGTVPALYGSGPNAKAIGPGQDYQLPEAPDDENIVEGHVVEEPDWIGGAKPAGPAGPTRHRLLALLQDNAAASSLQGEATAEQRAALGEILRPYGPESLFAILGLAWGTKPMVDEDHPKGFVTFTAAQAETIIAIEKSLATPEFKTLWIELAQVAAAKAEAA